MGKNLEEYIQDVESKIKFNAIDVGTLVLLEFAKLAKAIKADHNTRFHWLHELLSKQERTNRWQEHVKAT